MNRRGRGGGRVPAAAPLRPAAVAVALAIAVAACAPTSPFPSGGPAPAPGGGAPSSSTSGWPTLPTDDGAASTEEGTPSGRPAGTGTVTMVIDGDTVDVHDVGRIRVLGIDAPEVGDCGYEAAAARMIELVLGREVLLVRGGPVDADRYGRLLRYLDVEGVDAGRTLIAEGLAIARYDSRDGYTRHEREDDYRALDGATPPVGCAAGVDSQATAEAAEAAAAAAAGEAAAGPQPEPEAAAEPWNLPGPDLDCADIGKRVRITGPDDHRLDSDGDGWGCDSWG